MVRIRTAPRYVDQDRCTGCGLCMEKCPRTVASEFEEGIGTRKAIHRNSPQSVPNTPVIDTSACLHFIKGKCGACEKFCPSQAIDFGQEESFLDVRVGTIVLATGFDVLDPTPLAQYVITSYSIHYTKLYENGCSRRRRGSPSPAACRSRETRAATGARRRRCGA